MKKTTTERTSNETSNNLNEFTKAQDIKTEK